MFKSHFFCHLICSRKILKIVYEHLLITENKICFQLKTDSLPKVFVKMGSMHIARGQNWLGIYDLGNMIKELSYFNGTESTSINCFARFSQDNDGTIYDYLDDEDGYDVKGFQSLISNKSYLFFSNSFKTFAAPLNDQVTFIEVS